MYNVTEKLELKPNELPELKSENNFFNLTSEDLQEGLYRLTSSAIIEEAAQIEKLCHTIMISDIVTVNYFNYKQELQELNDSVILTAYEFIHLELVTKTGEYIYLYNHKPFTAEVKLEYNTLKFEIIHDAPFLHTTWDYSKGQRASSAAPIYPKGTKFEASFLIQTSKTKMEVCIPSYYPAENKACFILTDHCDFDTTEKLNLFLNGNNNNGWLQKNLKITKGVFRYGPKIGETRKSDDLEVESYKLLATMLHNDGSEICPHALKHSEQISGSEFNEGLEYLKTNFKPQTWIDHGSYLKYCYSQNGHLNLEYQTTNALEKNEYNNLWSFHDIALDPSLSLNYFHPTKYSKLNGIRFIIKHILKFNFLFGAHYLRSFIHKSFEKSLVVDYLNYFFACSKIIFRSPKKDIKVLKEFFRRLGKFKEFRTTVAEPFTLNQLNKYLPPIFTVNYQTINNWKGELLFFNTIETTHTKDIYTAKLLDQLIEDRGLHLGHTYILNSLPYINGIFDNNSKKLSLSSEWIDFTSYLSQKVRQNKIWNPNMGEFINRIKLVLNVNYYLVPDGVKVVNTNNLPILGFKLILKNNRELIADIPANSSIILNY